jgi:hypothetical protein
VTRPSDTDAPGKPWHVGTDLEVVANQCTGGACPTIYLTKRGTLIVQGDTFAAPAGRDVPDGEGLVEIPIELLLEAVNKVR